ncbi:hypothetical protein JK363_04825 [Streptomyces sp. 205]|uniref:Uncharacterized protein n=2 Tax=Streptomyces coffeae TaxID=621382 RepID=A0ABS1N7F8_9ACTN|nr:hypothetical protein [Streptomyces coffeae]
MPGSPAPRTDDPSARSPRTHRPARARHGASHAGRAPRLTARCAAVVSLVVAAMTLGGCMSISDDPERPDKHRSSQEKGGTDESGGSVVRSDGKGHLYPDRERDGKGKKKGEKKGKKRKGDASGTPSAGASDPEESATPASRKKHRSSQDRPDPSPPPQPGGDVPSGPAPEPHPTTAPPTASDPKPTQPEPTSPPASTDAPTS